MFLKSFPLLSNIVCIREGSKALLIISRELGVTGTIIVDSPGDGATRGFEPPPQNFK